MKEYKKKIKLRIVLLRVMVALAVGIGISDVFFIKAENIDRMVVSFQCGLAVGAALLALIKLMQYNKVLKDDKLLLMECNKENDERSKAIRAKAGMPMLIITSGLILLCGIIAGYFSRIVFITLIITALCQLIFGMIVKLYYMKRM